MHFQAYTCDQMHQCILAIWKTLSHLSHGFPVLAFEMRARQSSEGNFAGLKTPICKTSNYLKSFSQLLR